MTARFPLVLDAGNNKIKELPVGDSLNFGSTDISGVVNISASGIVTATDFNATSDTTVKDNIQRIEDPLASIVRIDGVTFTWKDSQKNSAGVTAQNLEEVLPNLVSQGELKSVNYNGLIGYLIEAVKELSARVDELESK
jgi:hypothetical protein